MKLIILDRDGTINVESDDFIKTPDEWVPLPGALEAIAKLNHAGWHTIIASNQSGLGRGLFDVAALNAIHAKMHKLLGAAGGRMDAVFYCPHTPTDNCSCRKPLPGLFNQIIERTSVEAHTIA
jgi:D-glycero-D-manno-heptose 1,7-bisphosphate phosphatase